MGYQEVFEGYVSEIECKKCDTEGLEFRPDEAEWGGEQYKVVCPTCHTIYYQVPDSYMVFEKTDR